MMIAPECTSSTAQVDVPGCYILPEFISEEEEKVLLDNEFAIDNQRWESTINRRFAQSHTHALIPSLAPVFTVLLTSLCLGCNILVIFLIIRLLWLII